MISNDHKYSPTSISRPRDDLHRSGYMGVMLKHSKFSQVYKYMLYNV